MQPTEGLSVPRRTLDVEDYIDILRRHKGWIFGPFLLTLAASVVGVYLWPNTYESAAVVQIVPQSVPESLVAPAVNQEMTDRINRMANTILSRVTLTTIIRNFDLYKREQSRKPIEDIIERMRTEDIDIEPVTNFAAGQGRTVPAFRIVFRYEDRMAAQRVVQDLVTRFIDENARDRNNVTYQTQQFLADQTQAALRQLEEVSARLTAFRVAHNGRLPDQLTGNMSQLQALQQQGNTLLNAVSRLENEKSTYQTQIKLLRDEIEARKRENKALPPVEVKSARLQEVEHEIESLDRTLADLRRQYKDTFPDVTTTRQRLEMARERREQILAEEAAERGSEAPANPVNPAAEREIRALQAEVARLEAAVQASEQQIENFNRQLKRNTEDISQFNARIQAIPVGQQEYSDLLREEAMARAKYAEMSEKLQRAQVAYEMEGRKQGETLALLDPASLPINPTAPKRGLVVSIGAGLGLLLGVVIAGAREMKDTSLKNLKDVRAYTQMAILGSIPLLENDFVVRRRKRIAWLGWTTACLMAAVAMAGSIVYYYATHS
jgi:succinoglycan biosynthesis transport protein ExoP